jgi:hypothetical protein
MDRDGSSTFNLVHINIEYRLIMIFLFSLE